MDQLQQALNYYNSHETASKQGMAVSWEQVAKFMASALEQALKQQDQANNDEGGE